MKKLLFLLLTSLIFFCPKTAFAYDPKTVPNNKFGIHILVPSEIEKASKLVDSSGGDWGYVTIPIQAGEKDIKKWQDFMDDCRKYHLIPILRLATEGDFFNTQVWRKPDLSDVLDFSNFLSSLNWPTQNKYVVLFNEVNRADEWGGSVNPEEYAQDLSYAVTAFKSKDPNFFIISAGMDNASVTGGSAMNEYTYFSLMNAAVPGVFNQIDGIASHSYPNPGFSMPSSFLSTKTIDTFYYEKRYIEGLASKSLPVFITETGWDGDAIDQSRIASFYDDAFKNVWNDDSVIAVTPFLLQAGTGTFKKFSFFDENGNPNPVYKAYFEINKPKGIPIINPQHKVLAAKSNRPLPTRDFENQGNKKADKAIEVEKIIRILFRF